MSQQELLRQLPSVDELARLATRPGWPYSLVVTEAREALSERRSAILAGQLPAQSLDLAKIVSDRMKSLLWPSPRRVINATGVVLHTNLGRAPLLADQSDSGYSDLEFDLETGSRGRRDNHTGPLLNRLIGAAAVVVNNNAAALFLALHELAAGAEVIISRGELLEIGEGFRLPDIIQRSGANLREVGTTNCTRIGDYRDAITNRTKLLLRVHPSNFRIEGFTQKPALADLVALAQEHRIPFYEDLGSGCVTDLREFGISEPLVQDSLNAGVDLVSFSGDKLLGGPQAGILAGRIRLISQLRKNPLFRMLRADKLVISRLSATLRDWLINDGSNLPVLQMIRLPADAIRARAISVIETTGIGEVTEGKSLIGGGSTPEQPLSTWLLALPDTFEPILRRNEPPIIGRVEGGRLLLDLRTVFEEELPQIVAALQARS